MPDPTTVLLSVNTANINQTNKNDQVVFSDNKGDREDPGHPDTYTSPVKGGSSISWSAQDSSSNNYAVKITNITKEGGSEIIDLPPIISDAGSATAQVKSGIADGTTEEYYVFFQIYNEKGVGVGEPYRIDPKMRMNNT